ncbi:Lysosome membrane protein 2 [Halotydeus destructor]|nr:Lysosome membrane protein 2 [Halotydeus destructor]
MTIVLLALGAILFLVGVILQLKYASIIESVIRKELVLSQGSDLFLKWSRPDIPIYMKYYFFDVQNGDEVELNGSIPVLKEKGPYTFFEKQWKEIVQFEDNGQFVAYKNRKSFHFLRDMSTGDLSDEVNALNLPAVAAIMAAEREARISDLGEVVIEVVSAVIGELDEPLFEAHSVDELLFKGYHVPFLERMAEIAVGFGLEAPNSTFGLMLDKNGSHSGLVKVHTGLAGNVFKVHSWNSKQSVNYWNGTSCNQINGTDGGGFGPSILPSQRLFVFDPDFCRSAYVVYKEETEVHGIPTYRFTLPESFFEGPYSNKRDNECFCTQPDPLRQVCETDGILDMSSCSQGAPVAMSPAHFLGVNPALRDGLLGMAPDEEKHLMYLDVEPTAGIDEKLASEFKDQLGKIAVGRTLITIMTIVGFLLIVVSFTIYIYNNDKQQENLEGLANSEARMVKVTPVIPY